MGGDGITWWCGYGGQQQGGYGGRGGVGEYQW